MLSISATQVSWEYNKIDHGRSHPINLREIVPKSSEIGVYEHGEQGYSRAFRFPARSGVSLQALQTMLAVLKHEEHL